MFRTIDPQTQSLLENYRLLLHCVSPRPIAFVSTLSADGKPNLAPFSYFMAGGANPPSVVISPTTDRSGNPKHTLRNIRETGEYVINVVTYTMRERMNRAAAEYPDGVSEWEEAGFAALPAQKVTPARVLDSPLALECRLHQIVEHGTGATSANYVIGEVVCFHAAESLFDGDHLDPRRVDYISRLGGDWYGRVTPESMFEMERPPRIEKTPAEG